jgi:hypothetical protein
MGRGDTWGACGDIGPHARLQPARPALAAAHRVRPKSAQRFFIKSARHIAEALMLGRQLGRRSWPGPDRIGGGRSALNIVYPLRYFQPCAETFDNSLQFVAPSITNLRETARSFRSKSGIQSWSLCLAGHACRSWMCSGASSDVGCKSPAPVSSLRRRRSPQRSSATRSGGFSPTHASAGKLPWFASLSRRAGGRRHHRVHETLRRR